MRTIGVVTVGRSDYGYYLPILQEIIRDPDLHLSLIVSGAHLSPEYGYTLREIESDGIPVSDKVEMLLSSDSPEGMAKSMGVGLIGFADVYARQKPDILVVLGDRFEMHAAALAALPFNIPVAHIHGGEETLGAIDNSLRHSITKLSHLHFTATNEYANRVIQMGEAPWRVIVSGAPSLDNLNSITLLEPAELKAKFHLSIEKASLLVTFHPVTLEYEKIGLQTEELLAALENSGLPIIFTMPNADAGNRTIRERIVQYVKDHKQAQAFENLGTQGYFSVMALSAAMVGNSSSGIIEAASFKLPVVNIGTRQKGRAHAGNVIDVNCERSEILREIQHTVDPEFRLSLHDLRNPYGDGHAAERIVSKLKTIDLDRLVYKPFYDFPGDSSQKGIKWESQ